MGCCWAMLGLETTNATRRQITSFMSTSPLLSASLWICTDSTPGGRRGELRVLFFAEDFAQQSRCLRRGVLANLAFFFTHYIKQAVHGFADYVFINAEALIFRHAGGNRILHKLVVLPHHADIFHRLMHNRGESCGQLFRARRLEVIGCG